MSWLVKESNKEEGGGQKQCKIKKWSQDFNKMKENRPRRDSTEALKAAARTNSSPGCGTSGIYWPKVLLQEQNCISPVLSDNSSKIPKLTFTPALQRDWSFILHYFCHFSWYYKARMVWNGTCFRSAEWAWSPAHPHWAFVSLTQYWGIDCPCQNK